MTKKIEIAESNISSGLRALADSLDDNDAAGAVHAIDGLIDEMGKLRELYANEAKMGKIAHVIPTLCSMFQESVGQALGASDIYEKFSDDLREEIDINEFSRLMSKMVNLGTMEKHGYRLMKVTPNGYRKYKIFRMED